MEENKPNETFELDYVEGFDVSVVSSTMVYHVMPEDIFELWFVEDIYSFCMKGRVSFVDRVGFTEFGNMSGTEVVQITYGQDNNKKTALFHIHSVTTSLSAPHEYRIDASLTEMRFKYLNYHSYSLSYPSNTGLLSHTDIVADMFSKYMGIDKDDWEQFENCNEKIDYFDTTNGTPAENIRWLLDRCSGSDSGRAGYLLYQNTTEKQWNLVTLEKLLQQDKLMYIYDKDEKYYFDKINDNHINKISSVRFRGFTNRELPQLSRGYLLGYDPTTRIFHHKTYNYYNAIDKYTILGQHSLFEDLQLIPYLNTEAEPINTGESDPDIMDNLWYGDWIKRYCKQQLIEVNVRGHEDRYAGGMIYIQWKSQDKIEERINQSLNGKFLVKSITHHFSHETSPKYQQSMLLIKNGFSEKQAGTFVKAKNKNI